MTGNRNFWIGACAVIVATYVAGAVLYSQSGLTHSVAKIALGMLVVHVLEIPLAFMQLKGKNAQPLRVIALTLLFGAAWWLPAKRGIFAAA